MPKPVPALGYLCLSENPTAEAGRALVRQFVLVREAERMGYDDIWLGEQHFDGHWPHGGAVALLGQLAAVTSKSRIGSMALLPATRDALQLAEDVATLDLISKGRFQFGVASGSAFAKTLAARGLSPIQAREGLHRTLDQVMSLLGGSPLPGTVADDGLSLVPRPAQAQVPVWIACDDDAGIERAAHRGWGLMAAATHTPARVRSAVERYTLASGGRAPELVLARFACTAATREEALAIARPYFESFVPRAQAQGWGADPKRSLAHDVEALLAESLVGQHTEVAAQFRAMAERYGATRIAILPTSAQFDTHKHILADFVDEVRPMLEDD